VKALAIQKLDELEGTIGAYNWGRRGPALIAYMLQGKDIMDEIRGLVATVERDEEGRDLTRERHRVEGTQWPLFAGLFAVSFLVFAIVTRLATSSQHREERKLAEQLVAMVGHDLRNPLNAITMSASRLKRQGLEDDASVNRILSSAARMNTMIVQILDLTRSRLGGGIPIERRTITLNDVVTAAVRELQRVPVTGDLLRADAERARRLGRRTPGAGRLQPRRQCPAVRRPSPANRSAAGGAGARRDTRGP